MTSIVLIFDLFIFYYYYSYTLECDVSDRENELRVQAPSMSNGFSKRSKISKKVDSFYEWKFLLFMLLDSLFNLFF
jgi:hypothetical protein